MEDGLIFDSLTFGVNLQVYKLQKGYTLHKGDLHKPVKNWNTGLVGASQLEDI